MNEKQNASSVRSMFAGISGRYDLMNMIMTFGRDRQWKKHLVKTAQLPEGGLLLDIGAGTGQIAFEAKQSVANSHVIAADFTYEMMHKGKQALENSGLLWCGADALNIPFHDQAFDSVTSGYLIRNVTDVKQAFEEQFRVLKPGGKMACLETSPPPDNILKPFILIHLKWIIPALGSLIAGERSAYEYLPSTTRAFKPPEEISKIMEQTGFIDVSFRRFMFGTITILKGTRPG